MEKLKNAKEVTKHYSSFSELREMFNLKPLNYQTADIQKLEKQREKFLRECPVCKQKLNYVYGTNICACQNPDCKGTAISDGVNEDGTEKIRYIPVTKILNENATIIAMNLFKND